MSLSERRSDNPTANECSMTRSEVGRLEPELMSLEAQLAYAERRNDQASVRTLRERIKWTRWGIRGANFTLEKCR